MADSAYWNAGDRPRVWINWRTFTDQGIPASWQQAFQDAVINAYTRWMMSAGVDCRFQFFGYTDRTEASDGEVLITMNERHFNTTRIASTFTSWRKANMVFHRRNGANLTNWNIVPYNAAPGEIDLQGVLTHEFGHCYWLDDGSVNPNDTMVGAYDYHRQRYGPWEGDVARVKAIYRDFDRNYLRELGSVDGGQSWNVVANQITSYNNYQARTCLGPGVTPIDASGLFALAWSHPNRIPTWLRTDSSTFLFNGWVYYGGERAVARPRARERGRWDDALVLGRQTTTAGRSRSFAVRILVRRGLGWERRAVRRHTVSPESPSRPSGASARGCSCGRTSTAPTTRARAISARAFRRTTG